MPLLVAFDGGDSPLGGCTTHLTTLFVRRILKLGVTLVDCPWLVRLNPAIPMKTRGNGATLVAIDANGWKARLVIEEAKSLLRLYASVFGSGKAGLAAAEGLLNKPPAGLEMVYRQALHTIVPREVATEVARKHGVVVYGGDGVVGAVAALGARLGDYTFEALAYMKPEYWGSRPNVKLEDVLSIDLKYPSLLANIDYETMRILIEPHGPDPVFAGIRGDDVSDVTDAMKVLISRYPTVVQDAILFRSNQHTGVHVRPVVLNEIRPYECVVTEGWISSVRVVEGGHVISHLCGEDKCVKVIAYRETGDIPRILQRVKHARVVIQGCAKPRRGELVVNIERLTILEGLVDNTPVNNLLVEAPPRAWHHLYQPVARELRRKTPREINPDKCIEKLHMLEKHIYPSM